MGVLSLFYHTHIIPIWRFPEMGVPPVIIHFNRMFYYFYYKPSSYWGSPMTSWKPPKLLRPRVSDHPSGKVPKNLSSDLRCSSRWHPPEPRLRRCQSDAGKRCYWKHVFPEESTHGQVPKKWTSDWKNG